nr:hypothetical protein Iba_chr02eCG6230 [Ipomoea batatas]
MIRGCTATDPSSNDDLSGNNLPEPVLDQPASSMMEIEKDKCATARQLGPKHVPNTSDRLPRPAWHNEFETQDPLAARGTGDVTPRWRVIIVNCGPPTMSCSRITITFVRSMPVSSGNMKLYRSDTGTLSDDLIQVEGHHCQLRPAYDVLQSDHYDLREEHARLKREYEAL